MLAPVIRTHAPISLLLAALLSCVRVEAGTDPVPLGYGPGPRAGLSEGYETDPVPRPAPTPWTPPARELAARNAQPTAPGPVPYNDDLLRVCKHLGTLQGEGFDPDQCLARYRVERVFRPITHWKTLAACLESAGDLPAVDACLRANPRGLAPIAEYPRESEVCMHIFAVTVVEQLGPEPMVDDDELREFVELLRECVDSLVGEERGSRKPAEYVKMLECIEKARSTAEAERCE